MYYYIISLYIFLSFISPPTTSSTFRCAEDGECQDKPLICSQFDGTCNVYCSASNACRGAIIECASGQECHVHCVYHGEGAISDNGQYICHNMEIHGEFASLLIVNASVINQATFQYPRTLELADIHCPVATDNGEKACQILCDGDDLMRQTTIYATNGMNDVSIEATQYTKPWCMRDTTLSCGANRDMDCTLSNGAPFECNGDISSTQLCTGAVVEPRPSPIADTETASPTAAPIVSVDDGQNTTDAGAVEVDDELGSVNQSYIYIEESYSDVPLDLSLVNWQLFLIILFSILSSISIIVYILQFHHAIQSVWHYRKSRMVKKRVRKRYSFTDVYYSSEEEEMEYPEYKNYLNDVTATEHIYKLFDDNGIHQDIIDVIIKDFCGYRNPPTLNAIIACKQQIYTKRRDMYYRIGCKLFVSHLVVITLIASLIFATYCGIIFVIQNDNDFNKYSKFVECECINNIDDLCKVKDRTVMWTKDKGFEVIYDSFYDEIWIPYIEKYEPSLIHHFQSNNSLYLTSNSFSCRDGYIYEDGWLYLSEEGLSDSDFLSNSNGSVCTKACCSCCQCWVGFAVACLILLMLILLTALVYIHFPIEQSVVHDFIIEGNKYLMKDIQRIINEIDNIDQLWQS